MKLLEPFNQLKHWQDPVNALLGAWLIASPWILGFGSVVNATSVAWLTGASILALAMWTLATDKDDSSWLHDRVAH